jgi:hypothetical protein
MFESIFLGFNVKMKNFKEKLDANCSLEINVSLLKYKVTMVWYSCVVVSLK